MTTKRPAPWLTTGDPLFDPQGGLFVNGYAFVPLRAARELIGRAEEEYSDTFLAGREAALDVIASLAPVDPVASVPAPPMPGRAELERRQARAAMERTGHRYVAPPRPSFAAGYTQPEQRGAALGCNVRVEGDEFVCASCARRWGRDEARPECPNDKGK